MLCSIGLTASYECEVKGAQLAHLPRHEVFGEHVIALNLWHSLRRGDRDKCDGLRVIGDAHLYACDIYSISPGGGASISVTLPSSSDL